MAGFFRRARAETSVGGLGLNIRHVMQWPKESNTEAFSAFTVATTERYENFLVGPAFDYDGDGRADRAIWRPSERRFYVEPSSSPSEVRQSRVFPEGSHPAPGDYDGDGLWDDAAWIQVGSDTRFEIIHSSGAPDRSVVFDGFSATHAVSGDFDGDGRHDPGSTLARRPGRGAGSLRAVATEDKNSISAVPAISRPLLDGGAIAARALPCFGLRRWKSCAEAQRLSALACRTMIPLPRTTTETESKIMESVGRRTGPGTSAKARTSASW